MFILVIFQQGRYPHITKDALRADTFGIRVGGV